MPKKKEIEEDEEQNKESELEEELRTPKIGHSEEEIESDELEELVKEIEEDSEGDFIDEEDLSEFLHFSSRGGPVLENIARSSQALGGRIVATPQMMGSEDREELGELYGAKQNGESPKYVNDNSMRNDIAEIDMMKVGRDVTETRVGEIGFRSSIEPVNSSMQEKYISPDRIKVEEAGRKNPFDSSIKPLEKRKDGKEDYVVR